MIEMKTKLFFVRHGFSVSNNARIFTGHMDIELTDTGKEQAEKCAVYFKDKNIDVIYASDLKRAYNTAAPIARELGLTVNPEKGMREIFAGDWEGTPFSELVVKYHEDYSVWLNDIGNAKCTNGESVKEFAKRIQSTVARIADENVGKNICIATHATPIRVICTLANGLPVERMAEIPWVRNASINIFEYDGGKFIPITIDYTDHLGEFRTPSMDDTV